VLLHVAAIGENPARKRFFYSCLQFPVANGSGSSNDFLPRSIRGLLRYSQTYTYRFIRFCYLTYSC